MHCDGLEWLNDEMFLIHSATS